MTAITGRPTPTATTERPTPTSIISSRITRSNMASNAFASKQIIKTHSIRKMLRLTKSNKFKIKTPLASWMHPKITSRF